MAAGHVVKVQDLGLQAHSCGLGLFVVRRFQVSQHVGKLVVGEGAGGRLSLASSGCLFDFVWHLLC